MHAKIDLFNRVRDEVKIKGKKIILKHIKGVLNAFQNPKVSKHTSYNTNFIKHLITYKTGKHNMHAKIDIFHKLNREFFNGTKDLKFI